MGPARRFLRFFHKRAAPVLPITEAQQETETTTATASDGEKNRGLFKGSAVDILAHSRRSRDDSRATERTLWKPGSAADRVSGYGLSRTTTAVESRRGTLFSDPFADESDVSSASSSTSDASEEEPCAPLDIPERTRSARVVKHVRNFSLPFYATHDDDLGRAAFPGAPPSNNDIEKCATTRHQSVLNVRIQSPGPPEAEARPRGLSVASIRKHIPNPMDAVRKLSLASVGKHIPSFSSASRRLSTFHASRRYPSIAEPTDPARKLSRVNLFSQRTFFVACVVLLNLMCLIIALTIGTGLWVLVFILIIKSKDVLSSILAPCGMIIRAIHHYFKPPAEVPQKWILSLIPAYSESEEQIVKCIFSLRDNGVEPHRQVMCVVLDGKQRDIKSRFTKSIASFERPYISFKHKLGGLMIHIGFLEDVPVIVIEKKTNGGKKDSLILAHDLFNYPRKNVPLYTQLLREELWHHFLPQLTEIENFPGFDMVFCTDADSVIHKGALASLTNALAREESSIAACGLVLVELEPGYEWSAWNLYQQFQYSFGQYVRRRAEHFWGKVTCLPGCITMIRVRPECAGAIQKYAEAVTILPVIKHQVQYLGTDRRLTYSLLSQSKKLTTLFVPEAVSETVAPQSLTHYLSQRRRWGSNAYFNNFFYMAGQNMVILTRLAAFIEVLRLSMVYYRFCNTILLVKAITEAVLNGTFDTMKLVPLLIVSQIPALWFLTSVIIEKELRKRAHKLFLGACINKCVAPFISMTVFFNVARNVGSQVWGISGVTAAGPATVAPATAAAVPAVAADATLVATMAPGTIPATAPAT